MLEDVEVVVAALVYSAPEAKLWDEHIEAGTSASSPFSGLVKLFVIRSGPSPGENGGWMAEERNIYQDYIAVNCQ